jgi:hypothetical protein
MNLQCFSIQAGKENQQVQTDQENFNNQLLLVASGSQIVKSFMDDPLQIFRVTRWCKSQMPQVLKTAIAKIFKFYELLFLNNLQFQNRL